MSSISVRRQIEAWLRVAIDQGWTVSQVGKHWKLFYPNGDFAVSAPCSPGGGADRSMKNLRAKLRRAGLEIK